ncbi:hypothetical protein K0M31_002434 [Melipona bicolor]|uniref:Uncharacterized protein n=1 Tax=Melipona bicolor TaxID=60889 RepID=A0AA40KZ59_9HYME|nr:hypothetical protein K0M31_002434 [Melipona bicolor]
MRSEEEAVTEECICVVNVERNNRITVRPSEAGYNGGVGGKFGRRKNGDREGTLTDAIRYAVDKLLRNGLGSGTSPMTIDEILAARQTRADVSQKYSPGNWKTRAASA